MRRRGGFTVLEAVVATVVLAIAMPPMLWGIRQAHTHRVGQTLASRARWLAAERLEDVIADRHSPTRGFTYLSAANYPFEAQIEGWPRYSRSVVFVHTGSDLSSAGSGYCTVTCVVMYNDGAGQQRTVSLSTVLTDYAS